MRDRNDLTQLRGLLQPGELLQWHGTPEPGLRLLPIEWVYVVTSPMLLGFFGLAILPLLPEEIPSGFIVAFLRFWMLGVLFNGVFPFVCALLRTREVYAITDQRVIIPCHKTVISKGYDQLNSTELVKKGRNLSILYLAPKVSPFQTDSSAQNSWKILFPFAQSRHGFYFIENGEKVHSLLQSHLFRR